MLVSLIVAMTPAGVIGRGGDLPWRLSADLQRFKRLTMGHAIIMGRKTWESIGRPLPGRVSIVISRQTDYATGHPAVPVVGSLAAAIELAGSVDGATDDEAFVIGGGEIYRQALPVADRLYVTRVLADVPGDTSFPNVDWPAWQLESSEDQPADERNEYPTRFEIYRRRVDS